MNLGGSSMQLQHLLSYVRRAIDDYQMIQTGDKIAVGISGGKDSLILLLALRHLQYFYPHPFKLEAITVSLGFDNFDLSGVKNFCSDLGINYTIYETEIAKIVFDERKESNPCSLCSKMRKGALYDMARDLGCNKIALGHNKDDINETFLMSLFYEGRVHTMAPVTYLDKMDMHLIRPLIYTPEKDVRGYVTKNAFPVVKSPCPADGNTKREEIKNLIYTMQRETHKLPENIFGAIQRSKIEGWETKRRS